MWWPHPSTLLWFSINHWNFCSVTNIWMFARNTTACLYLSSATCFGLNQIVCLIFIIFGRGPLYKRNIEPSCRSWKLAEWQQCLLNGRQLVSSRNFRISRPIRVKFGTESLRAMRLTVMGFVNTDILNWMFCLRASTSFSVFWTFPTWFALNSFDIWRSRSRASWHNYENNQQNALYRLIYYSKSALHVSGDVFAHHQEHLTVHASQST